MYNEEIRLKRPLRLGMVGGGRGSEIGYIHRTSAQKDGCFKLVAGAFDIDANQCLEFGQNLNVDANRCYANYNEMFKAESLLDDGIEVVTIATPNFLHYEISKAALDANLHVICEKPLCFTTEQAEELETLALQKNKVFGVTYGYSGAQMIHQAKKMIEHGDLGDIRIIQAQFAHGFQSEAVEINTPKTSWRVNPTMAGPSFVLGDLGTHIFFISELMTSGLKIKKLMCNRQSFVKTRTPLEDNAFVLMEYENGAVGNFWISAVNAGSTHQQIIRIVGTKGSIEWWDEHPNQLRFEPLGKPVQILDRGMSYLYQDDDVIKSDRLGAGHAEGLFEAWANLYYAFALAIDAKNNNKKTDIWYPDVTDGKNGVKWVEKCVQSADQASQWIDF